MKGIALVIVGILVCVGVVVGLRQRALTADPGDYARRITSAVPGAKAVAKENYKRYFRQMLLDGGLDRNSEFATTLSSLDLRIQDLEVLPIDEAYKRAHDAATKLEDAEARKQALLTLFNEVEQ